MKKCLHCDKELSRVVSGQPIRASTWKRKQFCNKDCRNTYYNRNRADVVRNKREAMGIPQFKSCKGCGNKIVRPLNMKDPSWEKKTHCSECVKEGDKYKNREKKTSNLQDLICSKF